MRASFRNIEMGGRAMLQYFWAKFRYPLQAQKNLLSIIVVPGNSDSRTAHVTFACCETARKLGRMTLRMY